MIKSEILYNRYINLLVWWLLTNPNGWTNNSIDYIEEKFHKIFNTYPDNLPNNIENYSLSFFDELQNYEYKWNVKLVINQIKILYYIYMNHPLVSHNSIRFKRCFNSFNSINNKNMIYLLHQNLREIPNKIINSDKLFQRTLTITRILNKIPK